MKRNLCKVNGCKRAQYGNGYCRHHYYSIVQTKKCSICEQPLYAKGYCEKHWKQFNKYGKIYKNRYELNNIIVEGAICNIKLSDGFGNFQGYAIIDIDDYERCKKYRWNYANTNKTLEYVQASINRRCVKLHQFILGTDKTGIMIDHKNLNGLDNRKQNLRKCTHGQNQQNSNGSSKRFSKYKGVFVRNKDNIATKWRAKIGFEGKVYHMGTFNTEDEAAKAYNVAAINLHGEFARLNIIGGA